MLEACIKARQSFAVDNTNPSVPDRKKYINQARAAGFKVIGYYFITAPEEAIVRNSKREGMENIPAAAIRRTFSILEPPAPDEGFDELYLVRINDEGGFTVMDFITE
jgi:predicted kinase